MRSVEKQLLPSMKVSREATLLPLSNEPYKGHSDGESLLVPEHRQEDSTLNIHTLEACYLVFLSSYSLQMHFQRSNNYPDVSFSPSKIVCLCMRCVTSTSAVTYWGRAHVIFFFFFFSVGWRKQQIVLICRPGYTLFILLSGRQPLKKTKKTPTMSSWWKRKKQTNNHVRSLKDESKSRGFVLWISQQ